MESLSMSETGWDRPGADGFPTTQWSRVIAAADPAGPQARESLASLCGAYWHPLYAYIRHRGYGPEQARDLTQEFFARALQDGLIAKADPSRGRFRSFLRGVCAHYLSNIRDSQTAKKRGGGRSVFSINAADAEGRYARELADGLTPERIFDRVWALTLLERVLAEIRREYADAGKAATFEALEAGLARTAEDVTYATIAERLGTTEGAARVAAHRLRRRYGELLRREIAATLSDVADVDDEINDLFKALEA
jgi:RNA polymerase sigma-70 factor (ECF subfamily)